MLLHCGHTFCASCLQKQARENKTSISCPTCQIPTLLDGDGVKNLWPDIYTTGLIVCNQKILLDHELSKLTPAGMNTQFRRDYAGRKEKLCRECCKKVATCRCDRCDFIMCKNCFNQVHSISNTLKQHQAIPLTSEESSGHVEVSQLCKIHEGKLIEYFCENDNVTVCSRCVITGDHKNHSIVSIEDKNKTVFSEMEPALQTANTVIKKMKKAEKSLGGLFPDMKSETADVIQEINTYFTGLHGILQAREKQLTREVYDAFKAGVEPLYNLKTQMQDDLRQLELSLKAAHRVLNNNEEVVLNAKEILEQLRQARTMPCIVEQKKLETTEKIRFQPDDSLVSVIAGHGSVVGTAPCGVNSFTLLQKPEYFISEDGESTGSKTPIDSVSVISTVSDDVIVEGEQLIDTVSSTGNIRSRTPDLDIVPSKEKIKGTSTTVIVTHIKNPCHFMVQKCSDMPTINNLSRIINAYGNNPTAPIPKRLERGDMILARYTKDNQWYRARVREIHPKEGPTKSVEVIYIDYGNHQKINIDRIRTIQPKHARHPELLIECCLHDIRPANETGAWSSEVTKTMQKMTEGKALNLVVIREVNNILHVDLSKPPNEDIKDDRPISVRDSLVFLELARFISPDAGNVVGQSAVRRTFMKPEPKSKGCSFTGLVTCSGDPSAFYVQEITEDSTYFAELMGQMQDSYNRDIGDLWHIYCPQMDMPCVCKYSGDDMWYRAIVIGIPGGKQVDVQYVDFGNTERVPHWRLRKILDHFIMMSVQALPCRLSDVTPVDSDWSSECNNWWVRKVTMKVFNVHVTDVDKSELVVILQEDSSVSTVNGELVGVGHANSTGKGSSAIPAVYLQKTIDSSDESMSLQSESLSSKSTGSYVTPLSSPMKAETSLRKPEVRRVPVVQGIMPGKPEKQEIDLSSKKLQENKSAIKSSSPQKENSPEKLKHEVSSSPRPALKLDVEMAARQEPIQSPSKASDTSDPDSPAVELEVIISHFVSPSNFYVKLANAGENGLDSLMVDMAKEYGTSEPQWVQWEEGAFCAAKYPEDKRWYRAKIINILHKTLIEVFMVDYGYTAQVSPSELRPLQKRFLKQMCHAFFCHLADIVSSGDMKKWSRTACEFMAEEVQNKKMYIQKKGEVIANESLAIDLLMEEDIPETALEPSRKHYYSLTDQLIEKGLAIPIKRRKKKVAIDEEEPKPKKIYPVLHWKPVVMPTASSFLGRPVYVDFEGVIWVQELNDEDDTLLRMIERLQEKFNGSEPHTPDEMNWQIDQAVVALFHLENSWHRAKILKVEGHRIQVQFVDFGNVEYVGYDKLRADVFEFIEIPMLCLPYILHSLIPISESGKWPVATLDYIHATVFSQPCIIEIEKKEVGDYSEISLTLPDKRDLGTMLCTKQMCYRKDSIASFIDLSNKIGRMLSQKKNPYPQVTLAPKNKYFPVLITHVEAPDVVYFQHCRQEVENGDERTDEINQQLNQLAIMSGELSLKAPMYQTLPTPRIGLPCLGQFTSDNCWYRGLIIDVNHPHQQLTVLYVDYGNSEVITYDRLRALPIQYLDLPAQGIRMKLNEVRLAAGKKYWTLDVMNAMGNEISNKQLLACLKTHSPVIGDLFNTGDTVGAPLQLAYQSLIERNLIQMPEENLLFDEALLGQIEDAVIIEGEEEVIDLDTSLSSTTTATDNSVQEVEKLDKDRQKSTYDENCLLGEQTEETDQSKSWSEQMEEDDSLD